MKKIPFLLLTLLFLLAGCGAAEASVPESAAPTAAPAVSSSPVLSERSAPQAAVPEDAPDRDWLTVYSPVFSAYALLSRHLDTDDYDDAPGDPEYDLSFNLELFRRSKARPGYCLEDLDGDGVPELIIGLMTDDFYYSNIVAAIFTLKEDAPVPVFMSSLRDRIRFLAGGGFLHTVSETASSLDMFVCSYTDGALIPAYGASHEDDEGFFLITEGGRENGQRTQVDEARFNEYTRSLEEMVGSAPILTMMDHDEG